MSCTFGCGPEDRTGACGGLAARCGRDHGDIPRPIRHPSLPTASPCDMGRRCRRPRRHPLRPGAPSSGGDPTTVTVLPPHVVHDGRAATGAGFHKRVAYLDTTVLPAGLAGHGVDRSEIADPGSRAALSGLHHSLRAGDDALDAEERLVWIARSQWIACGTSPPSPPRRIHTRRGRHTRRLLRPSAPSAPFPSPHGDHPWAFCTPTSELRPRPFVLAGPIVRKTKDWREIRTSGHPSQLHGPPHGAPTGTRGHVGRRRPETLTVHVRTFHQPGPVESWCWLK
jgi:hypothetical protein